MQLNIDLPCPTCGRPYPPNLFVSGFVRRRLVDFIGHRPDGASTKEIHAAVYATDPNGGPALKTIGANIWHANKQIMPQGYKIISLWKGPGGGLYVLRKLDGDTERQQARHLHSRAVEGPQSTGTAGLY